MGVSANSAQLSFTGGRVIANCVLKFVAMATGVGRGKILMTPSDSPGPKIGGVGANSVQLSFTGPSYSQFCPKIRCRGNGGWQGKNLNDTVKLADPENHTLEPKITTLSYT